MTLEEQVGRGLVSMGIAVSPAQRARLAAHLELVAKWNRVHNLTAVRETSQMVVLHLLDSLSILPHLEGARTLADIGTGPGFPGIPVAIVRDDMTVTLVESSHKKCAFLQQAKTELALGNVAIACERVEQFDPLAKFDAVVSRAFSDLSDFVAQAGHLVAPGGKLVAMKGVYPYDEIARVPSSHRVAQVLELHVPSLEAKRHLVVLEAA
ncbi:MAG TPA: 16S rRNA (guanine(527)-N(7))-methyltransferase RsmG [Usitatibacter sp.]|jgi:16S rRNA (guanine527-N7)-methyltransferase|nr:16S rRNA (guanine(527)-N(7))-methyltransferase RsmG [Usitatibacter sp.]